MPITVIVESKPAFGGADGIFTNRTELALAVYGRAARRSRRSLGQDRLRVNRPIIQPSHHYPLPPPNVNHTLVTKTASAGGIGSMRRGMLNMRNWKQKRERPEKACGLTRILCRRGSGGRGAGERARWSDFRGRVTDVFPPTYRATLWYQGFEDSMGLHQTGLPFFSTPNAVLQSRHSYT